MNQFSIWENLQQKLTTLPRQQPITICVYHDVATMHHTVHMMDINFTDDLISISSDNFVLEFSITDILGIQMSVNDMNIEYYFSGEGINIYLCIINGAINWLQ